jgi:transcription antitermination factor NusG
VDQNNLNFYCVYSPLLHGLSATRLIQEAFEKRKIKARLWLPMMRVKKMRYNTEIDVQVPLFPNYILVQAAFPKNMEQEMELALLDLKAGYFLKYPGDELPAIITPEEIARIQAIESKEVIETKQEVTYTPVEIGTFVEVATSPLMGLKGIVVDTTKDTVTIETFVFGRSAPVEVPISVLSRSTPIVASAKII